MELLDRSSDAVGATLHVDVVSSTREGAVVRVALRGELCAGSAPELRAALDRVIAAGAHDLVVDLAALTLCTSHGLEVFDACHRALRAGGGSLVLAGEHGSVRRLLAIVRDLDPEFLA